MSATTLEPPHTRLDGASVRHLINVLQKLQETKGQPGFDVFRNEETKHKNGLISYLKRNYSPDEIDNAWHAATQNYPSKNYITRGSKGYTQSGGQGQGDPTQGTEPTQAGQAQGGQSQSGQGQGNSQYPQRPSEPPQNDAFKAIADGVWPHIKPNVYDVAKEGDTALQQAIAGALRAIAAKGGTANGTVTIQTAVTLQTPKMKEPKNLGIQHKNFARLLKACNARLRGGQRLNVWLFGPPGTGKTTAGENVASSMELTFYSNSALATPYELLGFRAAGGDVVRTQFREAWEHGGVWLGDEIDASAPAAILALNAALANGFCAFPDGIVRRHPDCIILAGANTTGLGATANLVARNKLDSTTLDRFVFIDWPLDEGLEASLCADDKWLKHVRRIRGNLAKRSVQAHGITQRATIFGEALLAAGLEWTEVEAMTLRKGASDDVWSVIQ